ncbi:HAD family hydrolase [Arthrobacter sp. LAPM80]|uniref:HAD-IIB family hydrolase n=1 Tax=Arthrobacter sp. LAPM80 TaxID=3141788 RepID=UPI00398B9A2B
MNAEPFAPAKPIHAVFLDVDGTYADYGVVPEAHSRAVRAARAAGHKVLLCTGRPKSMLPANILAAGFDGLVTSAGAYVEVDGEALLDRRFPADLAARTLAALDAHNAVYIMEAQETLQTPPAVEARLRAIIEEHFRQAPDGVEIGTSGIIGSLAPWTADTPRISKISVYESPVPVDEIAAQIGAEIAVVANSIAAEGTHAGEMFQRGISKADGVRIASAHLGIARADTIAFGDGENDLEMLSYAGIGVAIEGSHPALLDLADRTAMPPSKDGIAKAFAELGLV